jgi:hypothetical protein
MKSSGGENKIWIENFYLPSSEETLGTSSTSVFFSGLQTCSTVPSVKP